MADSLYRREDLAKALLEASTQFTFPLNVHQFLRLGDQWLNEGFHKKLGIRATKLYREVFGEAPPKARARGCGRNLVAVYPRGILEQAWVQIIDELGEYIDLYRITPHVKVPPSPELVTKRREAEKFKIFDSEKSVQRWVKQPVGEALPSECEQESER
jgi:hypothetical protein